MYRFDLTGNNTFSLNLKGLKANADVALLDSSGKVMQISQHFGKQDEAIGSTLEAGTYYVKVIGRGRDTDYQLDMAAVPPVKDPRRFLTGDAAKTSGVFTVGSSGEVSVDYLLDGSPLQGELAIFNLKGMDQFEIGSKRYMQEAALRALGNSADSGYVVILDQTEGAKFTASAGEPNFNSGEYKGTKTFKMNPGDQFGVMLIPNGTTPDALLKSDFSGDRRPLFSIPAANSEGAIQFTQVADAVANDSTFAFEDQLLTGNSDFDYNDLVFQVQGAIGKATPLDTVIDFSKEWRESESGQQVEQFIYDPLDLAGNSTSAARKVSVASNGKSYRGWVGKIDSDDFYSFSLGATNKYQISLNGLGADTKLELMDYKGDVIQSSNNSGITPESLSGTLSTGAYRVRVTSVESKGTAFDLSLQVTPQLKGITTKGSEAALYSSDTQSNQLIHTDDNFRSGDTNLNSRSELAGIDGRGQGIVVIDSGINSKHPFFTDRIKYQQDFVNDRENTADDETGHGTLVASVAAGKDPDGQYSGVAPGADIIALKALDKEGNIATYDEQGNRLPPNGNGRWADVEQALQWVVEHAKEYSIVSVNMSFGNSENYPQPDFQLNYGIKDELEDLENIGVVVVAAAGNSYGSYLNEPGVCYPAANPNVIAVGAVWDAFVPNPYPGSVSGNFRPGGSLRFPDDSWAANHVIDITTSADQIAAFSQRLASSTMVFAPGAQIRGAGLGNTSSSFDYVPSFHDYTYADSGTSFAAPHVAGMVALAQQLAKQELPNGRPLTPAKFRELVHDTGKVIQEGANDRIISLVEVGGLEPTPEEKAVGFTSVTGYRLASPLPDLKNNVDENGNALQFRRVDMRALAQGILELRDPSEFNVDLSPVRLNVEETAVNTGSSITVNSQIQNTGLDPARAFKVYFYLNNLSKSANDFRLGEISVDGLTPNSILQLPTQTFQLPDPTNPYWKQFSTGLGLVSMVVDPNEDVKETDELNNSNLGKFIDFDDIKVNQRGTLTVTINRLAGNFDDDFYARVSFAEDPYTTDTWQSTPTFNEDNNDISPNWPLSQLVNGNTIPITIAVYDGDLSNKNQVDISGGFEADLNLTYNLLTGYISQGFLDSRGVFSRRSFGQSGQRLFSKGSDNGQIELTINFEPT